MTEIELIDHARLQYQRMKRDLDDAQQTIQRLAEANADLKQMLGRALRAGDLINDAFVADESTKAKRRKRWTMLAEEIRRWL